MSSEEINRLIHSKHDLSRLDDDLLEEEDDAKEKKWRAVLDQEKQAAAKENKWHKLRLFDYNDVPSYLQDNEYIRGGYRAYYSYMDNWRSLFIWHNESGNIWTHLLGFILFLCLMVYSQMNLPADADLFDHCAMAFFFICSSACFFCSTLFHTHYCHSKYAYIKFGCLDYAGISTMICGSCCVVTYFIFYCDTGIRRFWLTLTVLMASVGVFGPFYKYWNTGKFRVYRTLIYIISGFLSAMPLFIFLFFNGYPEDLSEGVFHKIVLMAGLYLLGAYLYANRIPECYFPGKLDILFHSHQFWHVCVVAACYVHYLTAMELFYWRHHGGMCPANN